MSNAADIIEALGGTVAVAKGLDLAPTTVSSWKKSGSIPRWRRDAIAQMAAANGIDLHAIAPASTNPTSEAA